MVKKWKVDDVDAESRVRNRASAVKKRKVDDVDAESRVQNRASAVKKRKVDDVDVESRKRNRASPSRVVQLNDSMLDIKCHHLHYPLIKWLAGKYDKYSREFVSLGRGRIPLNELAVYLSPGLPRGTEPVVYAFDSKVQAALGPVLFSDYGSTPKTTQVHEILKGMKSSEEDFKQIYVMYLVSKILNPSTSTHVSNRCYPVMVSFQTLVHFCVFIPFMISNMGKLHNSFL
jgi:hypothetical protein